MNSFYKKISVLFLIITLFAFLGWGLGSRDGLINQPLLTAVLSESMRQSILIELTRILALIQELQRQLNELTQEEKSSPAATTTETIVVEVIPAPPPKLIVNDLKFNVDFPFLRNKNYSLFNLFDFVVESKENIAITRLRFKQTGTLDDGLIDNFQLVEVVGGNEILLATFNGNPTNKFIEFNLVPNEDKPHKGLVVLGGHYRVLSTITVSYGAIKPTVSLSIEKSSDISVFDFNDLGRVADISASVFPIGGPIYTIST